MSVLDTKGMETPFEERIKLLNEQLNKHHKIIFICGAGLSTASGIPDFRSANGLYNQKIDWLSARTPEEALSNDFFNHNPKEFYRFYREYMNTNGFEPNIAHKKMYEIEQNNRLEMIITQNIDGLSEAAGATKILNMHGTTSSGHCIKCGKKFSGDYIYNYDGPIPRCDSPNCSKKPNAFVKPDVVLYGENLPCLIEENENGEKKSTSYIKLANDSICKADMMVIVGTSLQVYPIAELVNYFQGETIVTINRDPIPYDMYSDIIFREDIAEVFSKMIITPYN